MNNYLEVLRKYAVFEGRANREEYWYFFLFNFIISIILGMLCGFLNIDPRIANIYNLLVLLPGIAVGVRRMHDVNKSGWFLLIPIYNIILACTKGTEGENEYGPDPDGEWEEDEDLTED